MRGGATVPELSFAVEGAEAVEYAAAPTVNFALRIEAGGGVPVRAIALASQIRIAVARRPYDDLTRERLMDLIGRPSQWSAAPQSLFWAQEIVQVPAFVGGTRVDLPVACTYDFEVASAKYFHALEDGDVPLEFLFSGTIFYEGPGGALRTGMVPWDREATFRMPVRTWKDAIDHHFPNAAWIRLGRDAFDKLNAYRVREAIPTWEATIEALLGVAAREG